MLAEQLIKLMLAEVVVGKHEQPFCP